MAKHKTFLIRSTQALHCIKVGVAFVIGIIVMYLLPMPRSQWILISIAVVMTAQMQVGSIIRKSLMRTLGTILGACIALLSLIIFPNNYIAYAIIIVLSSLFFNYWSARPDDSSYIGVLGIVTVIMILFSQYSSLMIATYRTIEVLIGIFIALVVSLIFFPVHASKQLKKSFEENLDYFSELFNNTIVQHKSRLSDPETATIDQNIYLSFPKQRQLLNFACIEHKVIRMNKDKIVSLIDVQRDLYRAIRMLSYLHSNNKDFFYLLESYSEFIQLTKLFERLNEVIDTPDAFINSLHTLSDGLLEKLFTKYQNQTTIIGNIYVLQFVLHQFHFKLSKYVALFRLIFV